MDLQDIWQEHRRWILGVVAGVVVFVAGRWIVDGLFGGAASVRAVLTARNSLASQELYQAPARDVILAEHEALTAQVETLRRALGFVPADEFTLVGKGDADTYFPAVASRVRGEVLRAAQEAGVELEDANLAWPAPVGREEIAKVLTGLAAIEAAALRLVAAGERARALDPDNLGVVSIDALKILDRPTSGLRRPTPRKRGSDVSGLVREHRVNFVVRCDVPTLTLWLESLGGQEPPLALAPEDFSVVAGDQPGDPLVVKGNLIALSIDEPTADR